MALRPGGQASSAGVVGPPPDPGRGPCSFISNRAGRDAVVPPLPRDTQYAGLEIADSRTAVSLFLPAPQAH